MLMTFYFSSSDSFFIIFLLSFLFHSGVVGVEVVRGELKSNCTAMGIRFPWEQLIVIPLHRFVVPCWITYTSCPSFCSMTSGMYYDCCQCQDKTSLW